MGRPVSARKLAWHGIPISGRIPNYSFNEKMIASSKLHIKVKSGTLPIGVPLKERSA
jgi:hypothetical protein